MLGTITTRINIEKVNERGKKRLNVKLECHLVRPYTLPHEVSALYIYILIRIILVPLIDVSSQKIKTYLITLLILKGDYLHLGPFSLRFFIFGS